MSDRMQAVMEGLHRELKTCECNECPKCLAVIDALLSLEQIVKWWGISKRVQDALAEVGTDDATGANLGNNGSDHNDTNPRQAGQDPQEG